MLRKKLFAFTICCRLPYEQLKVARWVCGLETLTLNLTVWRVESSEVSVWAGAHRPPVMNAILLFIVFSVTSSGFMKISHTRVWSIYEKILCTLLDYFFLRNVEDTVIQWNYNGTSNRWLHASRRAQKELVRVIQLTRLLSSMKEWWQLSQPQLHTLKLNLSYIYHWTKLIQSQCKASASDAELCSRQFIKLLRIVHG